MREKTVSGNKDQERRQPRVNWLVEDSESMYAACVRARLWWSVVDSLYLLDNAVCVGVNCLVSSKTNFVSSWDRSHSNFIYLSVSFS